MIKVLVNHKEIEISKNSICLDLAKKLNLTLPEQALAAKVNGQTVDLSYCLNDGDKISFINFDDKEGKNIFWHTSAHVLAQAIKRLWKDAILTIGPAIDSGFYYDFANLKISESDFSVIEKEVKKIIKDNYQPKKIIYKNKAEALKAFKDNPYKTELIKELPESEITAYEQGDFIDLCRGPHLPSLGKIKAFKITKTSGAYWKGDNKREMLTRIYGISFPQKEQLDDYLLFLEEAKKRDHKLIGQQLDLFSVAEEAAGMIFYHPNGMHIRNQLVSFLRNLLCEGGYHEILTPILMSKELWERSGHWFHYRENMYLSKIEEKEFAIKPMNCPGCMLYYKTKSHSYRELPLRVSEIGHVHRHEPSGALNGLFRVRSFFQDDAHIFMKEDQIKDIILELLSLASKIYSTFGLTYKLELSTRPEKEKTIGTDEEWELSTNALKMALESWGKPYNINEGDGAFYGPKIDIHIQDALKRSWQCGTIQLDMSLPRKFDLHYVAQNGEHKMPIMLHRALYGSLERFFGILIEHFAGKFPLWLSPYPVRIIPVADRHVEYAQKIEKKIKKANILCDIDSSNESVSKKIRNSQLLKINYMLTVGDMESEKNKVSLRTRDNVVHGEMDIDNFLNVALKEIGNKDLVSPFTGVN